MDVFFLLRDRDPWKFPSGSIHILSVSASVLVLILVSGNVNESYIFRLNRM